jgi:hypothetical protein
MTSSSFSILAPAQSSNGSVALTSSTGSPMRRGLKPRGTSAALVWPRKSQTFYTSLARATWSYSSLLRAVASSWSYHSTSRFSQSVSSSSMEFRCTSLMSTVSSRAKIPVRISSRSFRSTARLASRLLRSDSRVVRASSSRSSLRSSCSSLSYSFSSRSATTCSC